MTAKVNVIGELTVITNEDGAELALTPDDLLTLAPALYGLARFALTASPLDDEATARRLQALDDAVELHAAEWATITE